MGKLDNPVEFCQNKYVLHLGIKCCASIPRLHTSLVSTKLKVKSELGQQLKMSDRPYVSLMQDLDCLIKPGVAYGSASKTFFLSEGALFLRTA